MIWFVLLACRGFEIETESLTLQCEADDLAADSEINWRKEGEDILVWRNSVYKPSDAIFTPELTVLEDQIDLREYWETEASEDEICFNPTVRILKPTFEAAELWWFIGDESISEDIAELELE